MSSVGLSPYHCGSCKISSSSPSGWLDHLRSEAHQFMRRRLEGGKNERRGDWEAGRTLMVRGVAGIPSSNILHYLAQFAQVQDFSYLAKKDGATNDCFLLIQDREGVDKILAHVGGHSLNGKRLYIREGGRSKGEGAEEEEEGAGGVYCAGCEKRVGDWLPHLASPLHQARHQKTQHLRKTTWDLERKVMVNRISGLKPLQIIRYLSSWGSLDDFSYLAKNHGGTSVCYALFASIESANSITETQIHCVERRNVEITLIRPAEKKKWRKFADNIQKKAGNAPTATNTNSLLHTDMILSSVAGGRVRKSGFHCISCNYEASMECEWFDHLCSNSHRMKSAHPDAGLRVWEWKNGIRMNRITGIGKKELLEWAKGWGNPVDFLYLREADKTAQLCHILFQSSEVVGRILNSTEGLMIGSQPVFAYPLSEYTGFRKKERRRLVVEKRAEEQMQLRTVSADPDPQQLKELLQDLTFENQIDAFMNHIGWSREFIQKSEDMMKIDIKAVLRKTKIAAVPKAYGSMVTKTGLKTNLNLQILLDIQEMDVVWGEEEADQQNIQLLKSSVYDLQLQLRNATPSASLLPGRIWINSFTFPNGSTAPEFCFSDLGSQSDVHIRFGNVLPLQESKLFQLYCKLDPRLLPFSIIILYWADKFQILNDIEEELFKNQVLLLLIIFFFEHKKIIPTVDQLQNLHNSPPKLVDGFNVSFSTDLTAINHKEIAMLKDKSIRALSIFSLLKEFFGYFGTADLRGNVVCTRFGILFPKENFSPDKVGGLRGDLARLYRFGLDGQPRSKVLDSGAELCIQDPFDLTMNLTKCLNGKGSLERFQSWCGKYGKVLETMGMESPNLIPIFFKRYNMDGDEIDNEETEDDVVPSTKRMRMDQDFEVDEKNDDIIAIDSDSEEHEDEEVKSADDDVILLDDDKVEEEKEDFNSWYNETTASTPKKLVVPKLVPFKSNEIAGTITKPSQDGKDDFEFEECEEVKDDDEDGESGSYVNFNLNRSLSSYFDRSFKGTKELKYQKLQALALQMLLEFNGSFWSNCFGLVFEPKKGHKFWPSDYALVGEEKSLTSQERLDRIDLEEKKIDVEFRIQTGTKIHQVLCQSASKSVKELCKGPLMSQLNLLFRNDVMDASASNEIRESSFVPVTKEHEMEFECRLTGSCVPIVHNKVILARLKIMSIGRGGPGAQKKVDILKKLCHRLSQSYMNRRVKQWMDMCSDFNRKKADNFSQAQHQRFNAKSNKKLKNIEKQKWKPSVAAVNTASFSGNSGGRAGGTTNDPKILMHPLMIHQGSRLPNPAFKKGPTVGPGKSLLGAGPSLRARGGSVSQPRFRNTSIQSHGNGGYGAMKWEKNEDNGYGRRYSSNEPNHGGYSGTAPCAPHPGPSNSRPWQSYGQLPPQIPYSPNNSGGFGQGMVDQPSYSSFHHQNSGGMNVPYPGIGTASGNSGVYNQPLLGNMPLSVDNGRYNSFSQPLQHVDVPQGNYNYSDEKSRVPIYRR